MHPDNAPSRRSTLDRQTTGLAFTHGHRKTNVPRARRPREDRGPLGGGPLPLQSGLAALQKKKHVWPAARRRPSSPYQSHGTLQSRARRAHISSPLRAVEDAPHRPVVAYASIMSAHPPPLRSMAFLILKGRSARAPVLAVSLKRAARASRQRTARVTAPEAGSHTTCRPAKSAALPVRRLGL